MSTRTRLLRQREFRLLFAGHGVSTFGDRLVMVALPFAVLSLPGSGLADVGLVLGAQALSLGLLVLVGGVWADRLPRHRTMLVADLVRLGAQGTAATLLLTGNATVELLMLTGAAHGAGEAFFRPALLGLVPQVVDRGQEQPANALLGLTDNLALVLGPAVAGLLVAVASPGAALAVDAATFAVSALALAVLRPRPAARGAEPTPFWTSLGQGWEHVRSRTWIWSTICVFTVYAGLVLPALFVLGPTFAATDRGGAGDWGIISAGFGIGAVAGSLLALRWRPQRPGSAMVALLAVGSLQAAIVVTALPTLVVAALEAVTGVAVALSFTLWDTAVQERTPPDAHSRVSSFDYFGSLLLMPLGLAAVGPVAARYGTERVAFTASAIGVLAALLVAASRDVRGLRRLPAAEVPVDLAPPLPV